MDLKALKAAAIDAGASVRTLLMRGTTHGCPCCGSTFGHFTRGGRYMTAKPDGYCPRCNSKPRHRWLWLNLPEGLTGDVAKSSTVLHIAPAYSTHRAFRRMHMARYVTAGLGNPGRNDIQLDITNATEVDRAGSERFDVVVCVHVLEHLDDDQAAIAGLARLVKPDGLVLVGVPIRDGDTLEDPSITDPSEREAVFGEPDHRRWYGIDITDRLQAGGFAVESRLTNDVENPAREHFGLKPGEGLFLCRPTNRAQR